MNRILVAREALLVGVPLLLSRYALAPHPRALTPWWRSSRTPSATERVRPGGELVGWHAAVTDRPPALGVCIRCLPVLDSKVVFRHGLEGWMCSVHILLLHSAALLQLLLQPIQARKLHRQCLPSQRAWWCAYLIFSESAPAPSCPSHCGLTSACDLCVGD